MTADKTNKALMWLIGILATVIISLVAVIWGFSQTRFDKLEANDEKMEVKIDTLSDRSKQAQWMRTRMVEDLVKIKKKLEIE